MANKPKKVWSNDPHIEDFQHLSPDAVRRYDLDLKAGRLKTDGSKQDHLDAMEALEAMKGLREWEDEFAGIGDSAPTAAQLAAAKAAAAALAPAVAADEEDEFVDESLICCAKGPKFSVIFDKFKAIMTTRDPTTFTDYEANVKEFEAFTGGLTISQICPNTITDFIFHLTQKGNTPPTIDKKVASLRALFNFGKKQKLGVSGENFAAGRNLVSKAEKEAGGLKFYELDEVKEVVGCAAFKTLATDCPNFHLIVLAELVS